MHTKYLLWIGVFIIANIVQLLYILSLRKNISEIAESFSEKLFVWPILYRGKCQRFHWTGDFDCKAVDRKNGRKYRSFLEQWISCDHSLLSIMTMDKSKAFVNYIIRRLKQEEVKLLNTFLYEAIFIPGGEKAPPKELCS